MRLPLLFSKRKNIFRPKSRDVSSANLSGFNLQAVLLSVTWEQFEAGMLPVLLNPATPAALSLRTHGLWTIFPPPRIPWLIKEAQ